MKKCFAVLISLLPVTVTLANDHKSWQLYKQLADDTINQSITLPFSRIEQNATKMVAASEKMLGQFIQKNPQCSQYLQAALTARKQMLNLSLQQIEIDYHADGKLPVATSSDCYHAKDLLVHAATVVVLTRKAKDNSATRKKIKHELQEVLSHLSQVQTKS